MFITQEQLKKRIESPKNVLNVVTGNVLPQKQEKTENFPNESDQERAARNARRSITYNEKHGEYTVNPNVGNDILRATVGILSHTNSSQQIQEEFGLTKNQVVGIKKTKRKSLAQRIENGKNKVSELALDRLMHTLGLMTPERIACEKVKDQSLIAGNLAKVVGQMARGTGEKEGKGISLTVITPPTRDLATYTTIDV